MLQKMGPLRWIGFVAILFWCLLPVAWIVSLSLKSIAEPRSAVRRSCRSTRPSDDCKSLLDYNESAGHDFMLGLRDSSGSRWSPHVGHDLRDPRGLAVARLEFNGKRNVLSVALAVAMFPVVALVGPLFDLWRDLGLFNILGRSDHPLHVLHSAARDLDLVGLLPGIPSESNRRRRWTAPPRGRRTRR